MTDDPEEIRAQARRASSLADDARHAATDVCGNSNIPWHSRGAERYRRMLTDRAGDFRQGAADFQELSRLLASHAKHVEDHEHGIKKFVDVVTLGIL